MESPFGRRRQRTVFHLDIQFQFGQCTIVGLFDFSLHCDTFIVNSCIEPMRKKKMLKILETDFKNLFLKSEKAHIKKKSSTFEQRISGKGFGKTIFTLSGFVNGQAGKVQIKHPLIRLRIQLDKLNINNP